MTTLLILGGTGVVGRQVLAQALANPAITHVVAPTRTALAAHPKLDNPLVDYARLPADAAWWQADAALCTIGTTMKLAGSQAAFSKVDHDYVLAAATLARAAGTMAFAYNSSLGAAPDASSFYLRVKATTEHDLAALGFTSLTIVRPSFLYGGKRADKRPGEAIALVITRLLGALIPKQYRPVSASHVAAAMLQGVISSKPGVSIIESAQLQSAQPSAMLG
ncbi:hypothetical protein BH11PSE12_BH11PSE12_17610 [soil metagenome]